METPAASPRRRSKRKEAYRDALKELNPVAFNSQVEREFVQLIEEYLDEGELTVGELRGSAAMRLRVSVETVKRYIEKYMSREGPFKIEHGVVSRRQ